MKYYYIIICFIIILSHSTGLSAQEIATVPEESSVLQENAIITIDKDFSDWEKIAPLARFSSFYNPFKFNREKNGKIEVHKIEDSVYWGYNGTQLKVIKALFDRNNLYFYFSTGSPITNGLLIFLYLYKSRGICDLNSYTIEITIDMNTRNGRIFLWENGKKEIIEVGIVTASAKELECKLSLDLLPGTLQTELIPDYSVDLTTCFFEKSSGMYEEYFFTTFYFKDIPGPEDL
ncbi:MAG: hypothetical protein JXJ04_08115 [Spirochaetales bacterium]|nr:hypothetical protein [Spirochaetales bacterium]